MSEEGIWIAYRTNKMDRDTWTMKSFPNHSSALVFIDELKKDTAFTEFKLLCLKAGSLTIEWKPYQ